MSDESAAIVWGIKAKWNAPIQLRVVHSLSGQLVNRYLPTQLLLHSVQPL